MKKLFQNSRWMLWVGILIGALIILAIRFITFNPHKDHVHYHANFAVYISGKRELFKDRKYYEEISVCSDNQKSNPRGRVHMHEQENDIIHVHDFATTWGNFFENLGWTLGPTAIINHEGRVYSEDNINKLHLILNGQDYTDLGGLANTVIKDKDRLLISFGNENQATINSEFKTVASSAAAEDREKDPASCGGQVDTGLSARFKHLF